MERIIIGIYSNPNIPPTLTDTEHHPTHLFSFSLLQNQLDVSGQKQSSIPAILRSHSIFFFLNPGFQLCLQQPFHIFYRILSSAFHVWMGQGLDTEGLGG